MSHDYEKPAMLYDGDCRFCQRQIEKWQKRTKDKVEYVPYQKVLADYPQVTEKDCKRAVQLIMPDGKVYSGAHAVFHALALASRKRLLWLYEHLPFFSRIAEASYQLIAHHRSFLSGLTARAPRCRK